MSPSPILNLPRELQDEILSYISRPTDLKSLCLVSKKIYALSIPLLYRDLILPYDMEGPGLLSHCLTLLSYSRSLEHVQTIRIGLRSHTKCGEQSYCSTLSHFLQKLGDNSLTRFELDKYTCLTPEQLEFLWQHQKRLRNLQFDFKHDSPTKLDLADLTDTLRSLKFISELDLDLELATVSCVVSSLLEILDLSHLQKFALQCSPHRYKEPNVRVRFWKTLFSDYFPITLTHLKLRFVSFIDNNLQLDNYPSLTHLALCWCHRSQDLFAGYSRPTLRSLSLVEYSAKELSDRGLADMLHRFRGLEYLGICISLTVSNLKTVQFLVDAINRHKDTLRYLLLQYHRDAPSKNLVLFIAELLDSIKKCKNLSQLGLSLFMNNMVDDCKELLAELPLLETLIVYSQPSWATRKGKQFSDFDAKIANQIMGGVSASSKFSLFAVGVSRITWQLWPTPGMQRHCFVRRRNPQEWSAQSGSGSVDEVAIRTEARTARYLVSESDLVDFSFELGLHRDLNYQPLLHNVMT